MPTYFARKTGNINAADVWATTPSGTASAVTFVAGDILVSNNFAITINVDTNLGGSGQVRNDTLGGATAGGTFTLNAGVTLTANVLQNNTTGGATVVTFSASAPSQAWIVGNVTSPVNAGGGSTPINISSTGTLNFTGNATGDLKTALGGAGGAIQVAVGGTLNFTGNATGGGAAFGYALYNASTGTINITGNCQGTAAPAVVNNSTGTVTINGQAIGSTTTGGGAGVANLSTGGVTVKRAIGGSYGPGSTGVTAAPGVSNSLTGLVSVEEIEFGANGMSPTSGGGIRLKKLGSNVAVFPYCDTAGAKTLIDATQNAAMPAASNVRSGVSYASGALTGSCAVPDAGSVALGVPVDATTGTAVLTPAAIRSELSVELGRIDAAISSRLAPSGTLATVTNLTNAPASVTPSDIWSHATRTLTTSSGPTAVEIRQEMDSNSTKLANLDTTVSSRLAPSGTLATVTTLTNAPTVPTPSQIASQVRTELSTELARVDQAISSRLAGSAYTAPANSDIAGIKAKTDNLPTAPAAVSNIPTAAQNASATRSELSLELARVDAAISTRATPANIPTADITAIKAKTDAVNVDRINNTATLSQVGNLLAQANS